MNNKSKRDLGNMSIIRENRQPIINQTIPEIKRIIDKELILPHKKPIDDILINMRDTIYKTSNLIMEDKNPLPYIYSDFDIFFSFSAFILILGITMLLLSNIME